MANLADSLSASNLSWGIAFGVLGIFIANTPLGRLLNSFATAFMRRLRQWGWNIPPVPASPDHLETLVALRQIADLQRETRDALMMTTGFLRELMDRTAERHVELRVIQSDHGERVVQLKMLYSKSLLTLTKSPDSAAWMYT
ncbi:hypothetical protein AAE478_000643 [Parahypoxylon ruwenzoriense]